MEALHTQLKFLSCCLILVGCYFIGVKQLAVEKNYTDYSNLVLSLGKSSRDLSTRLGLGGNVEFFEKSDDGVKYPYPYGVVSQNWNSDSAENNILEKTAIPRLITLGDRSDLGLTYQPNAKTFNPKRKYAVIIVNRPDELETIAYQVNLPIACQTWISIGYGCFVAMVNDPKTETNQTTTLQNLIYSAFKKKFYLKKINIF